MDTLETDRRLWGHCSAAHQLWGWCANCAGQTIRGELEQWRDWAYEHVPSRPSPRHAAR
jgi:hypothetical protein